MSAVRALSFVLSELETGRAAAHALVCPDARYCSVARPGVEQLERRFVQAADWRMLISDLGLGLPSGPLPDDHAVVRILLDAGKRRSFIVQYVADVEMALEPLTAAGQLDGHLRGISG